MPTNRLEVTAQRPEAKMVTGNESSSLPHSSSSSSSSPFSSSFSSNPPSHSTKSIPSLKHQNSASLKHQNSSHKLRVCSSSSQSPTLFTSGPKLRSTSQHQNSNVNMFLDPKFHTIPNVNTVPVSKLHQNSFPNSSLKTFPVASLTKAKTLPLLTMTSTSPLFTTVELSPLSSTALLPPCLLELIPSHTNKGPLFSTSTQIQHNPLSPTHTLPPSPLPRPPPRPPPQPPPLPSSAMKVKATTQQETAMEGKEEEGDGSQHRNRKSSYDEPIEIIYSLRSTIKRPVWTSQATKAEARTACLQQLSSTMTERAKGEPEMAMEGEEEEGEERDGSQHRSRKSTYSLKRPEQTSQATKTKTGMAECAEKGQEMAMQGEEEGDGIQPRNRQSSFVESSKTIPLMSTMKRPKPTSQEMQSSSMKTKARACLQKLPTTMNERAERSPELAMEREEDEGGSQHRSRKSTYDEPFTELILRSTLKRPEQTSQERQSSSTPPSSLPSLPPTQSTSAPVEAEAGTACWQRAEKEKGPESIVGDPESENDKKEEESAPQFERTEQGPEVAMKEESGRQSRSRKSTYDEPIELISFRSTLKRPGKTCQERQSSSWMKTKVGIAQRMEMAMEGKGEERDGSQHRSRKSTYDEPTEIISLRSTLKRPEATSQPMKTKTGMDKREEERLELATEGEEEESDGIQPRNRQSSFVESSKTIPLMSTLKRPKPTSQEQQPPLAEKTRRESWTTTSRKRQPQPHGSMMMMEIEENGMSEIGKGLLNKLERKRARGGKDVREEDVGRRECKFIENI